MWPRLVEGKMSVVVSHNVLNLLRFIIYISSLLRTILAINSISSILQGISGNRWILARSKQVQKNTQLYGVNPHHKKKTKKQTNKNKKRKKRFVEEPRRKVNFRVFILFFYYYYFFNFSNFS